jgi:hypothetical protein
VPGAVIALLGKSLLGVVGANIQEGGLDHVRRVVGECGPEHGPAQPLGERPAALGVERAQPWHELHQRDGELVKEVRLVREQALARRPHRGCDRACWSRRKACRSVISRCIDGHYLLLDSPLAVGSWPARGHVRTPAAAPARRSGDGHPVRQAASWYPSVLKVC